MFICVVFKKVNKLIESFFDFDMLKKTSKEGTLNMRKKSMTIKYIKKTIHKLFRQTQI